MNMRLLFVFMEERCSVARQPAPQVLPAGCYYQCSKDSRLVQERHPNESAICCVQST